MWILADILMFGSVFGIGFILGKVYERRMRMRAREVDAYMRRNQK